MDCLQPLFGREDLIPMWVADMDFPVAQPIVDCAEPDGQQHPFYGYTQAGPTVIEAVVERMRRKFQLGFQPEWIVFTPGVVPALHAAVRTTISSGDEIIIQQRCITPFFLAVSSDRVPDRQ